MAALASTCRDNPRPERRAGKTGGGPIPQCGNAPAGGGTGAVLIVRRPGTKARRQGLAYARGYHAVGQNKNGTPWRYSTKTVPDRS